MGAVILMNELEKTRLRLLIFLRSGPKPVNEIAAHMEREGFAWDQVLKAKAGTGIVSRGGGATWVLGPKRKQHRSKRPAKVEVSTRVTTGLSKFLEDGPKSVKDIELWARGFGVSWRILRRAKDQLRIVAKLTNGVWTWENNQS